MCPLFTLHSIATTSAWLGEAKVKVVTDSKDTQTVNTYICLNKFLVTIECRLFILTRIFLVVFKKITTFFNLDMFRCYKHHRQERIFEKPLGLYI